jgi:hypothetical protein
MSYAHYDRLTALDLSFLRYEEQDPNVHMHVGVVALFERGPLAVEPAGIDIDRIRIAVPAVTDRTGGRASPELGRLTPVCRPRTSRLLTT